MSPIGASEKFCLISNIWIPVRDMPIASDFNVAAVLKKWIYIVGLKLCDVLEYSPIARSYRILPFNLCNGLKSIVSDGKSLYVLQSGEEIAEFDSSGKKLSSFPYKFEGWQVQHVHISHGKIYYSLNTHSSLFCIDTEEKSESVLLDVFTK